MLHYLCCQLVLSLPCLSMSPSLASGSSPAGPTASSCQQTNQETQHYGLPTPYQNKAPYPSAAARLTFSHPQVVSGTICTPHALLSVLFNKLQAWQLFRQMPGTWIVQIFYLWNTQERESEVQGCRTAASSPAGLHGALTSICKAQSPAHAFATPAVESAIKHKCWPFRWADSSSSHFRPGLMLHWSHVLRLRFSNVAA